MDLRSELQATEAPQMVVGAYITGLGISCSILLRALSLRLLEPKPFDRNSVILGYYDLGSGQTAPLWRRRRR